MPDATTTTTTKKTRAKTTKKAAPPPDAHTHMARQRLTTPEAYATGAHGVPVDPGAPPWQHTTYLLMANPEVGIKRDLVFRRADWKPVRSTEAPDRRR